MNCRRCKAEMVRVSNANGTAHSTCHNKPQPPKAAGPLISGDFTL